MQRRNLVETDTESGTLSYNSPQTVYNRLSGTITWLPQVGQEIKPGQTLYKVDGEPVLLMNGTTPAYRDLGPSDSDGADIEQLNRNLVKLGFNAADITVDDVWQPATTEGVDLLQESLGETETGILTLGQIVFLPGDQLVTTVDGTLGSTGGSGGTNASATVDPPAPEFASYDVPRADSDRASPPHKATKSPKCPSADQHRPRQRDDGHDRRDDTASTSQATPKKPKNCKPKKTTKQEQLAALIALLKAETAAAEGRAHGNSPGWSWRRHAERLALIRVGQRLGRRIGVRQRLGLWQRVRVRMRSGSGQRFGLRQRLRERVGSGGSATAILQTTSTQLVVTVDLSASVQSEAVVGEHVTVEMPAGNTSTGRSPRSARSPRARAQRQRQRQRQRRRRRQRGSGNGNGNGSGSSSTIPVTITLNGHISGAGLDQAAVSVNFVEQRPRNVLSVPVTALLATAGGSYAVQAATAPHQLIPVTTGLFAAGYVQISGSGIYPGLEVTDSQG